MIHRTIPQVVLWVMISLGGLGFLFITVTTLIFASPPSALIGLAGFLVYLVAGTLLLRWSPLWPSGGGYGWYAAALLWGAFASTSFAVVAAYPVVDLVLDAGWDRLTMSYGGAYPEELLKTLGVVLVLGAFAALRRPWHGFLVGVVVGLGFELTENLLYVVGAGPLDPNSDANGSMITLLLRLVAGPLLHGALTGLSGAAISWALWGAGTVGFMGRLAVAVAGWCIAFIVHFMWNYQYGDTVITFVAWGVICLVLYPSLVWLWIRFHKQAKADGTYPWVIDNPITSVAQLPAPQPAAPQQYPPSGHPA